MDNNQWKFSFICLLFHKIVQNKLIHSFCKLIKDLLQKLYCILTNDLLDYSHLWIAIKFSDNFFDYLGAVSEFDSFVNWVWILNLTGRKVKYFMNISIIQAWASNLTLNALHRLKYHLCSDIWEKLFI